MLRTIGLLLLSLFIGGQNPGPSITGVNASPPVVPTSYAGLQVWYSADCYTLTGSVCSTPSAGTLTTAWDDRSGNGVNMTVNGTCTFTANVLNSLPGVTFDGSTCYFSYPALSTVNDVMTAFIVVKLGSTSVDGMAFGGNSHAFAYHLCDGTTRVEQAVDSQEIANMANGNALCDLNWHNMNVQIFGNAAGSTYSFRLGESSDGSGSNLSGQDFTGSDTVFGADGVSLASKLNGTVVEMFMYRTAAGLTSQQILNLEAYLKAKYGI